MWKSVLQSIILLYVLLFFGQVSAFAGQIAPCEVVPGNLLQNCGFETGDFTSWTQSGNTDSTFVFASFDGFSPNSGSYFAALGPANSDGKLSQTFATIAGDFYSVSWYLASDGQTPNDFNVTWDGNSIFSATDLTAPDWVPYTFSELASGTSTTLTFAFRSDLGYLALDDTSVLDTTPVGNATPEPGTFFLLVMAGAAALWRGGRHPWMRHGTPVSAAIEEC